MSSAFVGMLMLAQTAGLPPAPQDIGLPSAPAWRPDSPAPVAPAPLQATKPGPRVEMPIGALGRNGIVPRSPDGHFYVDGLVNGVGVRFVVDTGASAVMLTPHDAGRVGLSVGPERFTYRARTAGGMTSVAPVRLDRVALAGREVRDVPAVVSNVDLGVSLLGMSYLQRLRRVVIENDILRLE